MDHETKTTNISAILEQNEFGKISDNREQIVKFVQSMKGGEHVIFLWENEESKNQMISEFFKEQFRGGSGSGLFSVEPTKIQAIKNILYQNFYNTHKSAFLDKAVEKVTRAMSVNDSDKSTRYAFEDDTWLMRRGLKKQVLDTEELLGKEVHRNLSLFCMDHRPNLDDDDNETIEKLIKAHGYVIIDEPLALYKWKSSGTTAAVSNNNHLTSREISNC